MIARRSRCKSIFNLQAASKRRPDRQTCRPRLEALEDRCLLSSDVVIEWNQTLLNEIRANKTPPPPASRIMAIVQVAVFDAVNGIDGSYTPYVLEDVPARDKNGSLVAAAAQAAHDTLVALYPQDQAKFDAQLQTDLATIRSQGALKKGVEVGHLAASAILKARANDGANSTVPYTPGTAPGVWQPTPPGFLPAAFPQWATLAPFAMTSDSQFRPPGQPALTSDTYAKDYNEVKSLGGDGTITPSSRTPEQTTIAKFWADGAGTETPPGHWNTIAQDVAQARGTTLVQNARLFALLDLALADAAIIAWDAKYTYNCWRPVTAIRNAGADGNPNTVQDPNWTPLLVTPNFPSYTSGHSTFSSAGAAVLANFFGTDHIRFTTGSDFLPGVTRSFTSFSAAAAEAGQSRIYAGIHFQFDNQDGLHSGKHLGAYVFQQLLRPEDDDEGGGSREGSPRGEIVNHGTGSSPSELSTLFYQLNGAFTAAHAGIGASKPNSALTAESSGSSPALTSRTIQADVKPPNQPHIVMAGRTAMTVKASDHLFAQFAGEQDDHAAGVM